MKLKVSFVEMGKNQTNYLIDLLARF